MKSSILLIVFAVALMLTGCSQTNANKPGSNAGNTPKIGGGCEGCEAIYESPVPLEKLNAVDTLPDFYEAGPKIGISGILYQADGRTPAKDVVMYVYHTDQKGKYPTKGGETGWGKRHGYIRGWVKTDQNGFYQFYTLVPASYPNSKNPKHIHAIIKEAGKNEYYISDFLFNDDPYLTPEARNNSHSRGGDGIIKPSLKDGMLRGTRHIILGLNIPGYPLSGTENIQSGLATGSDCPAFDPFHLSGADKNKSVCPMCKYGYGRGVMVWFNHPNLDQLKLFAKQLEGEIANRGEKNFRVFLVYMNPFYKENDPTEEKILKHKLQIWCAEQGLSRVALVWVPSPVDKKTCGIYDINPLAKNTVLVYKKRKIAARWVNIDYDDKALHEIMKKIDLPI